MNHTIKILTISIVSLFIITMVVFLTLVFARFSSNFKMYFDENTSKNLIAQKEYDVVNNIKIDANTSNIKIESSNDKQVLVEIYSENPDEYFIKLDNDELAIHLKDEEHLSKIDNYLKSLIIINVPNDYDGNIVVDNNVGDIKVTSLPSSKLKINLNVGDLKIDEINDLEIKLNVGDILVNKINNYLDISLDTGDVLLRNVNIIKNSIVDVKIGDVIIEKANNVYFDANTKIGDVIIEKNNEKSNIKLNINVNAGDIKIAGNRLDKINSVKDLDIYNDIKIDEVKSVDVTKYTEGGDNRETYKEKEDIMSFYKMIGETKLGEETEQTCDDNTTVYTFNMNDDKVSFEFECNWLVLDGKRYLIVK